MFLFDPPENFSGIKRFSEGSKGNIRMKRVNYQIYFLNFFPIKLRLWKLKKHKKFLHDDDYMLLNMKW